MRVIRKMTAAALALTLSAAALGGCAKGGTEEPKGTSGAPAAQTSGAVSEKEQKPVSLTLCSSDNTFGLSTDPELQQAVIDMLEEKTKTEIKAIIPPSSSYNDKLETMISGGDVPDIFYVSQAMTRLPNYAA